MMQRFSRTLALRIVALLLVTVVTTLLAVDGRFVITPVLLSISIVVQAVSLGHALQRTNREVARFLAVVEANDFSERFERERDDVGFDELGRALSAVLKKVKARRGRAEADLRLLRAILDQVPVPLISVSRDGQVERLNQAARRFFGARPIVRREDLRTLSDDLERTVETLEPGQSQLVDIGARDRILVSVSLVRAAAVTHRVFALQSLRSELERTEVEAWQALVRVLTHELMNSLTPVRSLALTAADLLGDRDGTTGDDDVVEDARVALSTVAKRTDGLMSFIKSYRQIAKLPKPVKAKVPVSALFDRIVHLFSDDSGGRFECAVVPRQLHLHVDPEQIEQVLINLVRNAIDAHPAVRLELHASIDPRGRPRVTVSDNGPGISADVAAKMFVPFFTTKREGSGVGLSLTRQIMRAHGGFVSFEGVEPHGARFILSF